MTYCTDQALLDVVNASPEAVAQHDKTAWLDLFAASGVVEDPVGVGVERLFAVWPLVRARRRELDYLAAVGRAVWAEGIDVSTDAGLVQVGAWVDLGPDEVLSAVHRINRLPLRSSASAFDGVM